MLTNVSALPGKREPPKLHVFTWSLYIALPTRKQVQIITWLQLNHDSSLVRYLFNSVKCCLLSNTPWILFVLSATQHIRVQHTGCATQLAVALQNFISSTSMVPAAQRWTQLITLQDWWSHTASWVWAASQQYWRNHAATGCTLANHLKGAIFAFPCFPGSAETLFQCFDTVGWAAGRASGL